MAIFLHIGCNGVGDGKSYCLTNDTIANYLRGSRKHVYTTVPCDGEQKEHLLAFCFPKGQLGRRAEAATRLHFLYQGKQAWFQEFWEKPMTRDDVANVMPEIAKGFMPPLEAVRKKESDGVDTMGDWQFATVTLEDMPPDGGPLYVRAEWPTSAELVEQYKEDGYRYRKLPGGVACRVAQFWHFVPAGAVVVLDEAADDFGSDELSGAKDKRMKLGQVLRIHRHYKTDLHVCCQNWEDLDPKVRRLCDHVLVHRNLKKSPFIDYWMFRGLRWPIQCFEVKQYLGSKVARMSVDQMLKSESVDGWRIFPAFDGAWFSGRGFKNYRSFSESSKLPGKALADEKEKSADLDSPWDRVKGMIKGLWKVFAMLGFGAMAAVCLVSLIYTMAGADSGRIGHLLYGNHVKTTVKNAQNHATNAVQTVTYIQPATSQTNVFGPAVPPALQPVYAVLVSPGFVRLSDGSLLRRGDDWPGRGRVTAWDYDGVWIGHPVGIKFAWAVLFQRQRN